MPAVDRARERAPVRGLVRVPALVAARLQRDNIKMELTQARPLTLSIPSEVSAVVSGGKLVDVTFLQYPDAGGHTTEVSNFALPQLRQEAIVAQSANVNIVSGATQDSQAFQQSLAAALSQAKS